MPDLLKQFYSDSATRNSVKEFIMVYLREKAVELTFNGEETKHIKLAREILDDTWNRLEQLYGEKQQKPLENPAR